jgi:ribosomal protein L31
MIKRFILVVCFCLCATALNADIVFDVCDVSHPFYGFGAQIWPGDIRVESLTKNLNLKYYRISLGGSGSVPTDATTAEMDNYVNSVYNGTLRGYIVETSLEIAQNLGVKTILIKFGECPKSWLTDSNELKTENFDDFARVWASEVLYFKNLGYKTDYIELFNEPEGQWNVYCPPSKYNTVVKLVRAEMDSRGLSDVGIIGPGLAVLQNGTSWINALDANAKNAIAAWSTHAWDEGWGYTGALPSFLGQRWQNYFGAAVNSADPQHLKPVIITEYATGVQTYNGVSFDDDEFCNSSQFAERCYENSLTLANDGANVLCYWEAANQSWQDNYYGFMRVNSTYRPVYYAFMTLAPYIPDNAKVLTKTWNDTQISAAGFVGSGKLVMAFANCTANTVTRTIRISNAPKFHITSIVAFQSGAVIDKTSNFVYNSTTQTIEISLSRESTLTIAALINGCTEMLKPDLNNDCKVTFADFSIVASDWMKDNTYSPSDDVEDFQSYSSSSEINTAWVIHTAGDPVTETLENENGNKCLKLLYNTNGSNGWLQTKHLIPGAVWLGGGINWEYRGYTDISFKYKIADKGSSLTQFTIWNSGGSKIAGADIGNGAVTDGWVKVNLNMQAIKVAGMNYQSVGLIGFTAKNYSSGPTGDLWVDDVVVTNNGTPKCFASIDVDINGDCMVDFEDVYQLSSKWLNCSSIEQSECW